MKKITVIIPLHEFNKEYITKALSSIKINEKDAQYYQLLIVGPQGVCKKAEKIAKQHLTFETRILVNEETDFNKQINKAVFDCVTPYFTILEYDDTYTENYFELMQRYAKNHPEYSIILPINEYHNMEGEFLTFGNEVAIDPSFADEIGVIGLPELEVFMDFNCTGGLFKTEDFISVGGLKESLKIASWYEFLLRTAYKGKLIYVIPKIGYLHTIGREGSYMVTAKQEISQEEGKQLIELAKQEYFFKEDRNKTEE